MRYVWPILFSLLTASTLIFGQEAPTLKFTGAPLETHFGCSEEDLNWAGLSCSAQEPCPIYLELSSVIPNGKKILVSGNLHSSSGTLYSILLMSGDSGETWSEPAKRIRGTSLDHLQFYDFQNGWAAGEILYPLPRDPFFLVTTDGGASWRQRPVTEDGGAGSVQRFWFDSAQHGELIVDHGTASGKDRYSLYESQTGGESWNIEATTSKLPAIRRAPPLLEQSDWRVRTSKNGKSYEIQRRDGDRWSVAAAFLIQIAECKTAVDELKEPPSEGDKKDADKKDYVEELKLKPVDPKPPVKKKP